MKKAKKKRISQKQKDAAWVEQRLPVIEDGYVNGGTGQCMQCICDLNHKGFVFLNQAEQDFTHMMMFIKCRQEDGIQNYMQKNKDLIEKLDLKCSKQGCRSLHHLIWNQSKQKYRLSTCFGGRLTTPIACIAGIHTKTILLYIDKWLRRFATCKSKHCCFRQQEISNPKESLLTKFKKWDKELHGIVLRDVVKYHHFSECIKNKKIDCSNLNKPYFKSTTKKHDFLKNMIKQSNKNYRKCVNTKINENDEDTLYLVNATLLEDEIDYGFGDGANDVDIVDTNLPRWKDIIRTLPLADSIPMRIFLPPILSVSTPTLMSTLPTPNTPSQSAILPPPHKRQKLTVAQTENKTNNENNNVLKPAVMNLNPYNEIWSTQYTSSALTPTTKNRVTVGSTAGTGGSHTNTHTMQYLPNVSNISIQQHSNECGNGSGNGGTSSLISASNNYNNIHCVPNDGLTTVAKTPNYAQNVFAKDTPKMMSVHSGGAGCDEGRSLAPYCVVCVNGLTNGKCSNCVPNYGLNSNSGSDYNQISVHPPFRDTNNSSNVSFQSQRNQSHAGGQIHKPPTTSISNNGNVTMGHNLQNQYGNVNYNNNNNNNNTNSNNNGVPNSMFCSNSINGSPIYACAKMSAHTGDVMNGSLQRSPHSQSYGVVQIRKPQMRIDFRSSSDNMGQSPPNLPCMTNNSRNDTNINTMQQLPSNASNVFNISTHQHGNNSGDYYNLVSNGKDDVARYASETTTQLKHVQNGSNIRVNMNNNYNNIDCVPCPNGGLSANIFSSGNINNISNFGIANARTIGVSTNSGNVNHFAPNASVASMVHDLQNQHCNDTSTNEFQNSMFETNLTASDHVNSPSYFANDTYKMSAHTTGCNKSDGDMTFCIVCCGKMNDNVCNQCRFQCMWKFIITQKYFENE